MCTWCFFRLSGFFFYPLLGYARFRGRCWAAIRLSHRPEPSGRAVRGEVDGLDVGRRHGRRFVLLHHTHRPQRRSYPVCTSRSGNVRHRCGGSQAGPRLFLGGSFRVCAYRYPELTCGILWGCPPTPRSIDDLLTAPHVCCCERSWWVAVRRVQMDVSIWGAVQQHSMDVWALSGADVQAPWHGILEIVWLHCDKAEQVGCLRGLEGCPQVTQASSHNSQGVVDGGVNEAGMSTVAPNRRTVLCSRLDQG